ncbi:MAG: response regulator transcription factor [Deltaproteobacteria bacterium]|nr:response regulator transcription factor [Deltaproteobacteria bacterium]
MFRILLVDDDELFRATLRRLLDSRFSEICLEEAADGVEALLKVGQFNPDAVFMDIQLPGENGLSLTKKIKKGYPEIIVIILTSHDLPEYREAAQECGADYFASKQGSTAQEVLGVIEALMKAPS